MGQMGRTPALTLSALILSWTAAIGASQDAPRATPQGSAGDELPGPRVAIAGLRALECASTVAYAGAPNVPHRLLAVYAFPDRARWWLGIGDEGAPQRQMRLRFGGALNAIDPGSATSRRLFGDMRSEALIQLEMRRALLLWPHGFEWQREGTQATTRLGSLGTLSVRFEDAHALNPSALTFTGIDGREGDSFRALVWRETEEKGQPGTKVKAWPAKLELWHEQLLVWRETVDTIDTQSRFVDSFFVPPDQREASVGKAMEVGAVRALDLPEFRSRRFPLEANATWDAARAQWKRLTEEQGALLKSAQVALDDKATFEVSESLAPTAVLLRLVPSRVAPAAEIAAVWPLTIERPGLSTFVIGLAALKPDLLPSVRGSVPQDARAGAPYVRFDPARPDQHVLLVVPLLPRDG